MYKNGVVVVYSFDRVASRVRLPAPTVRIHPVRRRREHALRVFPRRRRRKRHLFAQNRRFSQTIPNLHAVPAFPGTCPLTYTNSSPCPPCTRTRSAPCDSSRPSVPPFSSPEDASRILTLPDAPARAMLLRVPVTRRLSRKPPPFHRTLKTFPLGHPGDVHVLSRDEMRRAERRSPALSLRRSRNSHNPRLMFDPCLT